MDCGRRLGLTGAAYRDSYGFMPEHTPYQKKIIEGYYQHRDGIMLGKLGEIVTELYLAESDRKKAQLWKRAEHAMKSLSVPPSLAEQILLDRDPEALARHLREWQSDTASGNRSPNPPR
jgi:hypothetical protein